ncbi:hypothetical protein SUGI_1020460 [Cryptomeria japonica]|nr:hypothetical protein SUGI_1020460 [Cryptomeria japonica]
MVRTKSSKPPIQTVGLIKKRKPVSSRSHVNHAIPRTEIILKGGMGIIVPVKADLQILEKANQLAPTILAKQHSHDGVKAGAKAAAIAFVASAIPVLMGARAIPWARANLNYAAQAHIISLVEQPISLWQIKLFWPLPGKTHSKNWVPWKHRSKWQE